MALEAFHGCALDTEEARAILGVSVATSLADVRRAYMAAARRWHPEREYDTAEDAAEAAERFRLVFNAYRELEKEADQDGRRRKRAMSSTSNVPEEDHGDDD